MGKDVTDYAKHGLDKDPLQSFVSAAVDRAMNEKHTGKVLTLGQLISKLEKALPTAEVGIQPFNLAPTTWGSYRGIYRDLALGYSTETGKPKVKEFLESCRECIGKVFTGYKGGDFLMDEDTFLWVANDGESNQDAIVGVQIWPDDPKEYQWVELICQHVED